ncbi:hypothetical protein PT974_02137 [Cladobotryum mycophilum]|uniref:Fatty acid hydroxylase domain-containing protein n=1 Tax=Cladobotryum mycophilum TaxID=491253 RepID=A0ABR0SXE1_9HYPO
MDFLLSINILLYMLSPSPTSWSTTLNVLFFYMTWSTLVLSHSPLFVHVYGVLAIRIVFFIIPSLLSLLFDASLPSLAEKVKHGGRSALPPRDAKALSRLLGLVMLNLGVMTGVEGALSFVLLKILKGPVFRTSTALPLPWQMFKHVVILLAVRGGLQYYIHRSILHGERYSAAKKHRDFAHARSSPPFSLLLMADHPIPLMLHRLLPLFLPALLLRPHLLTYFLFTFICTMEETLAMSGYIVVPIMFMTGIAQRTAVHYAGEGRPTLAVGG